MTWVIGSPTMFGYSVCIADVQASWVSNGRIQKTKDCVQKLHPISRFFTVGFSGSIYMGYEVVSALQGWFNPVQPQGAWIPEYAATKITKIARRVFKVQTDEVKKLGLSLLMASVSPKKDDGIPGEAMTQCYIIRSPCFAPEPIQWGFFGSIGSGSDVGIYKDNLNKLNEKPMSPLMQMEVGNPKGYAAALMSNISLTVRNNPTTGISRHFQVAVVERGQIYVVNNDYTANVGEVNEEKIVMPKLAKNLVEFKKMSANESLDFLTAIA